MDRTLVRDSYSFSLAWLGLRQELSAAVVAKASAISASLSSILFPNKLCVGCTVTSAVMTASVILLASSY